MTLSPDREPGSINLASLLFTAKIDFITVFMPGKVPLPPLDGTPRWAAKENHRKLSIHDPSPRDVLTVAQCLEDPRLAEVEVAVDMGPADPLSAEEHERLVEDLMIQVVAKGLAPEVNNPDLQTPFRGVFEVLNGRTRLRPYNRVLPRPGAQQLHGLRNDPLQTKAYPKKQDQGRRLEQARFVARQEVRLSGAGLAEVGLGSTSSLLEFRYRKKLMPYLRHVRGAARRRRPRGDSSPVLDVLHAKKEAMWQADWARIGAGAFVRGGTWEHHNLRLLRATDVNNRIGQALLRLEKRMKFVRDQG